MLAILSAVVWFVPTDPSLALSVVAAPSVNDGSAAVLGCGNLARYGEAEMDIGAQIQQGHQRLMSLNDESTLFFAAIVAAYTALYLWLNFRDKLKSVEDDFNERERKLVAQNAHQQSQLAAARRDRIAARQQDIELDKAADAARRDAMAARQQVIELADRLEQAKVAHVALARWHATAHEQVQFRGAQSPTKEAQGQPKDAHKPTAGVSMTPATQMMQAHTVMQQAQRAQSVKERRAEAEKLEEDRKQWRLRRARDRLDALWLDVEGMISDEMAEYVTDELSADYFSDKLYRGLPFQTRAELREAILILKEWPEIEDPGCGFFWRNVPLRSLSERLWCKKRRGGRCRREQQLRKGHEREQRKPQQEQPPHTSRARERRERREQEYLEWLKVQRANWRYRMRREQELQEMEDDMDPLQEIIDADWRGSSRRSPPQPAPPRYPSRERNPPDRFQPG